MILEGIASTRNEDGSTNVSPMGPRIDAALSTFLLRPFATSRTYENLKRTGQGVFHVTDDVELIAQAAVKQIAVSPELIDLATKVGPSNLSDGQTAPDDIDGAILAHACRWFAFRVTKLDDSEERTEIECRVYAQGEIRPFLGFNRAKHAVLEAAILATRIHFLPAEDVARQFEALSVIVEKTAGDQERRAFAFLQQYVDNGPQSKQT